MNSVVVAFCLLNTTAIPILREIVPTGYPDDCHEHYAVHE